MAKAPMPPKRSARAKPSITVGGTSVNLGRKAPTKRGNQGGKG